MTQGPTGAMRITFLLPRFPWHPSGGYIVVYRYASELAARGHDVAVVHPRRLPAGGWRRATGVRGRLRRAASRVRDVIAHPTIGWARIDPRVRMLYVPELSAAHIPDGDTVIATWWSTAEAALALPRPKGVVHHLVQGYEVWDGEEERVHAVWRAPVSKIVIASWLVQLGRELGVPEELMTHIPNAIDLDTFTTVAPVESRRRHVAMLYAPHEYKGGPLGLEILGRAKQRVPDMTAFMFGADPPPLRLPHWITYRRAITPRELAHAFNECSVYLCPSLSEGWHLPPAEAMACGCALVSSDIGGVADYARGGETAWLYPPGDAAAGADRLATLLLDDPARVRLAYNGLERIRTFSWARSADRLEALLSRSVAQAV